MSMPEIARFIGASEDITLDFVEHIRTPIEIMKLGLRLHLAGLSLSETGSILETYGYELSRSTLHNWVKKSDLEPEEGCSPDRIALDETVVNVEGQRFWLYAAVDADSNSILHIGLYPTRTTAITERFLSELAEKHDVEEAEFLVDGAPWLHAGLFSLGMHFRHETFGGRNPVERIFQEIKRRTNQFYNIFSRSSPESAENWLKAIAWTQNNLI